MLLKWSLSCARACSRRMATRNGRRCYHELSYASHGDPSAVLEFVVRDGVDEDEPPSYLREDGAVQVEMWHAPLNPADVNTIQGKYPSPFPDNTSHEAVLANRVRPSRWVEGRTVAGSEGWGRVTNVVGNNARGLDVGDVVVVGQPGLGTFRSSVWTHTESVLPLKHGHQLRELFGSQVATISQLGGTALRMLRDFVTLQPGDVVLQNAGNSGVGILVSQLAKSLLDVSVVSLARRGSRSTIEWEELVDYLMTEGNCVKVLAEEDLLSSREALQEFKTELKRLSHTGQQLPSLALNAVGGESASILCKCLEKGGMLVTYGGMSMKPVTIATPQFIFRDLRACGYWHSSWMVQNSLQARQHLVDELADAVLRQRVVCPPVVEFPLSKVDEALKYNPYESAIRRKIVFRCQE